MNWVIRWSGKAGKGAATKNPLYYAAAESTGGTPSFYAGDAYTYELCSVSGCFPHIIEYPRPPYGGTEVTGKKVVFTGKDGVKHYLWVLHVPLSVVGSPPPGARLQSFGSWTFARNKPANIPITNQEGESGLTPVMVDGACCKTQVVTP